MDRRHTFVRLGDPPETGRSFCRLSRKYEPGISVYSATVLEDGRFRIRLPRRFDLKGHDVATQLALIDRVCLEARPVYEAAGAYVGLGNDGEPLLAADSLTLRSISISQLEPLPWTPTLWHYLLYVEPSNPKSRASYGTPRYAFSQQMQGLGLAHIEHEPPIWAQMWREGWQEVAS